MKKKYMILVFAFLLLVPISKATDLDYYEATIDLDSEKSNFTLIFLFEETPKGIMEYPLSFETENFKTSANFQNYTCTSNPKEWGTLISCDFSEAAGEGRALNIKFNTEDKTEKIEKKYHFTYAIKTPQDTKKMNVKTVLKRGFVLIEEPEQATTLVPYSPSDGSQGSDGRRIYVEWEREDLKKGEGIEISLTYEKIGPGVSENNNIVFLLIGILIFVLILIIGFRSSPKSEINMNVLKKSEKKVIEIIKERGGFCKQRDIVKETDFSKAKVSRIIKDLEERNLITSEKAGRSKKIFIKKPESD